MPQVKRKRSVSFSESSYLTSVICSVASLKNGAAGRRHFALLVSRLKLERELPSVDRLDAPSDREHVARESHRPEASLKPAEPPSAGQIGTLVTHERDSPLGE